MSTPECFASRLRGAMVVLGLLLVAGRGPGVGAVPMYTVEHLNGPNGSLIYPTGINNTGQVVGLIGAEGGPEGASFLYDNRGMHVLQGTLGGSYTYAFGINDAGQVVGVSGTTAGRLVTGADGLAHAFLYDQTGLHDLGTLGGSRSWAAGINNAGQVTGWALAADRTQHAFLYSGGVMRDIGTQGGPGSGASPSAINDSGQIAGDFYPDGSRWHAFLYDGAHVQDLGIGYERSFAHGINDAGQVVGEFFPWGGYRRAFVCDGAGLRELAPLVSGGQSVAYRINGAGQIIGCSEMVPGRGLNHAVLWENGQIHDLNDLVSPNSGLVLEEALCINDLGQIAARGQPLRPPDAGPSASARNRRLALPPAECSRVEQ